MSDWIDVAFGWRLPNEAGRVKAVFHCQILERDESTNRWLIRLDELRDVSAARPIPQEFETRIHALAGKYAYAPAEASQSMTLPMKLETLTGEIRYFHARDPRLQANSKIHG